MTKMTKVNFKINMLPAVLLPLRVLDTRVFWQNSSEAVSQCPCSQEERENRTQCRGTAGLDLQLRKGEDSAPC